jgi:fructose-bisphosphate aldolase, class I
VLGALATVGGVNDDMLQKVRTGKGFIAALDQSGGSTPKALALYGVGEDAWSSEDEMFDLMHAMRTRIMTSPAFTGDRVLGAILFEQTMDREVEGVGTSEYLWSVKNVVPFLKVDKGLADVVDGAQIMKPIPGLRELCERAVGLGVFGTKMRSVVQLANEAGVNAVVDQQFEVAKEIIAAGLVPIIEPEVDITSPEKQQAEALLRDRIATQLDALADDETVMLKLSIPTVDDFYADLIAHPKVLRVVALSGGYPRDEANERLSRQHGMIASFSRALTESLSADQSDTEFDAALAATIDGIYAASIT